MGGVWRASGKSHELGWVGAGGFIGEPRRRQEDTLLRRCFVSAALCVDWDWVWFSLLATATASRGKCRETRPWLGVWLVCWPASSEQSIRRFALGRVASERTWGVLLITSLRECCFVG